MKKGMTVHRHRFEFGEPNDKCSLCGCLRRNKIGEKTMMGRGFKYWREYSMDGKTWTEDFINCIKKLTPKEKRMNNALLKLERLVGGKITHVSHGQNFKTK